MRDRRVSIGSRNKSFEPHVEVVPLGGSVSFPNHDDIMHNVFSLTKGNKFDLGLYKSGAKKDFTFASPGLVRVYCNIHPQMSALLQVMENPYFAWTSPDGGFLIDGVPARQLSVESVARGGGDGPAGFGDRVGGVGSRGSPRRERVRQAASHEQVRKTLQA